MSVSKRERDVNELLGAQYPQAANMGVFSIHMICEDDDLKNIGMDSFTGMDDQIKQWCWGRGHSQSFSIVTSLGRDIEGDPTIRFFERHDPDVLEVGRTGSSPDAHG